MRTIFPRKYAPSFSKLTCPGEPVVESDASNNCIRLYKSSPKGVSLQIFGFTGMESPVTHKAGKPEQYLATVSYLSVEDLRTLQAAITECIKTIEE